MDVEFVFERAQRKAVNMLALSLYFFLTSSTHTFIHILTSTGGCEGNLERERYMIGISMNAQNRCCCKTGEWVKREDGWCARLCGCIPNVKIYSHSLGVTKVRPWVLRLIITLLPVLLSLFLSLFPLCVCVNQLDFIGIAFDCLKY